MFDIDKFILYETVPVMDEKAIKISQLLARSILNLSKCWKGCLQATEYSFTKDSLKKRVTQVGKSFEVCDNFICRLKLYHHCATKYIIQSPLCDSPKEQEWISVDLGKICIS